MSDDELGACLESAVIAATRAADLIESYRKRITVREKGRADLVTDADLAAETLISQILSARHPAFNFLGEENPGAHQPNPHGPPLWIVDPIDGTTNYVHDIPFYAVSIGLEVSGEIVLGVTFDPRHGELFKASRGQGAWLADQPLRVSATTDLDNSLLTMGFAPDLRGKEIQLAWWNHFAVRCRGMRRTGSASLNIAYVAAGRFDAFWANDCNAWDIAAGVVMVREAGGRVTGLMQERLDVHRPEILATNGHLHDQVQLALRASTAN